MLALLGVLLLVGAGVGLLLVIVCALSRCPHCRAYHTTEAEQLECDREHGEET